MFRAVLSELEHPTTSLLQTVFNGSACCVFVNMSLFEGSALPFSVLDPDLGFVVYEHQPEIIVLVLVREFLSLAGCHGMLATGAPKHYVLATSANVDTIRANMYTAKSV